MTKRIFSLLMIICITVPLVSCQKLSINIDMLRLEVGQLYDLSSDVDGDFVVSSSSDIVSVIAGTVIRAERSGEGELTVSKGIRKRKLKVVVDYAYNELTVTCDEPYVTEVGAIVHFKASLGLYAEPDQEIDWYVNGAYSGEGYSLDFALPDYGKYTVGAVCHGQAAYCEVACFVPTDEATTISASSEVYKVGEQVTLTANCDPSAVILWFIDGEKAGSGAELRFTADLSGEYTAFALVNGVATDSVEYSVRGVPHDVLCDFDSDYPNVTLRWEGANVEYEVAVDGTVYDASSPRMSGKAFDLSGFDLKKEHTLAVNAVGGLKAEITSPALTDSDIKYLSQSYLLGNYYMADNQEVYDIIDYAMAFRNGEEKIKLELKMGYDCDLTPALLLCNGWLRTEQTGVYKLSAKGETKKGKTLVFTIECFTGNEPTDFDPLGIVAYEPLCVPSFGGGLTSLYVDSLPKCEVASSEQLFFAVSNGFCPVPTNEHTSELYTKVRETLKNIISDDMDEERRVRAVFDWIMWTTAYDFVSAEEPNIYDAVESPAYYLEGVFQTGFAVCDGIAKSASLMCNMLGIPCIRVVGTATQGSSVQRHAWNKVKLGGNYYVFDATWSDTNVSLGGKMYEGGLHNYYLVSDDEASDHVEGADYPKAYFNYGFYNKNGLALRADFDEFEATLKSEAEKASFEVKIGDEVSTREFACLEFKVNKAVENFFKKDYSRFTSILNEYDASHTFFNGLLLIRIPNVSISD